MHPEKKRMGSDYVYIAPSPAVSLNYHDAVEYCLTNHNAELPKIYRREDMLGIMIAQRELNSKEEHCSNAFLIAPFTFLLPKSN